MTLTTIEIPVTAFVKKVVFAKRQIPYSSRTENYCIALTKDDELADLLKYSGRLQKTTRVQLLLTHTLTVSINESDVAGKDWLAVGLWLDKFYKNELCKDALSRAKSQTERTTAVREYFRSLGIDEDDYAEEAALKRIQRFDAEKVKKNKTFSKKKTSNLPDKSKHRVGKIGQVLHIYTDAELEQIYQTYRRQYPRFLLTTRMTERKDLPQKIRVWIFRRIGNRTPLSIAHFFGIDESTVRRNIRKFEQEFSNRPKPLPFAVLSTP